MTHVHYETMYVISSDIWLEDFVSFGRIITNNSLTRPKQI